MKKLFQQVVLGIFVVSLGYSINAQGASIISCQNIIKPDSTGICPGEGTGPINPQVCLSKSSACPSGCWYYGTVTVNGVVYNAKLGCSWTSSPNPSGGFTCTATCNQPYQRLDPVANLLSHKS